MIETDMAKRLRSVAEDISYGIVEAEPQIKQLLLDAAKELDIAYNGMVNWKRTAESKDAEFVRSRRDKEAGL